MEPPSVIVPEKLGDYLEVLTKAVFESGMSWRVIEAKWDGFRAAFRGFDPEAVANLSPDEVDALTADTRIIRNRRKIEATVHNAATMLALDAEFHGFQNYLQSQGEVISLLADMKKRFKFVGDFGAYYFLYVVGQPVPEHHEFRAKLLEGAQKARA
ncbi:MAG: DNA-3-methyladenine glycosylase I [Chloroflexi bacterium]|nr:DNA-3-methyladenine glycosylase I [Chloroflexota bacterium]